MRKLLNNLFITNENAYLSKKGTNVIVNIDGKKVGQFPIHVLENIICNSHTGASPALIQLVCENNVTMSFCDQYGNFRGRVMGRFNGNVLLRREQYRIADREALSLPLAKNMIFGKIANQRYVVSRILRDHREKLNEEKLKFHTEKLKELLKSILETTEEDSLRGLEGDGARSYFSIFDNLVLQQREDFEFKSRSRRPPEDRVNALLSYGYTILTHECVNALETVGLDPYAGFFHKDRPGRASLALDMMEELRPIYCDRFVLSLINKQMIKSHHFEWKENDAVLMTKEGKKIFLEQWNKRRITELEHPYLLEKIPFGLIPYVQALLLARTIRKDIEEYPPYLAR